MDGTAITIISIATSINFISVKVKFDKHRYSDATLDLLIFVAIAYMFSGTMSGLTIGMISSAMLSTYLWFSPPKEFFKVDEIKKKTTGKGEDQMFSGVRASFLEGIAEIKKSS